MLYESKTELQIQALSELMLGLEKKRLEEIVGLLKEKLLNKWLIYSQSWEVAGENGETMYAVNPEMLKREGIDLKNEEYRQCKLLWALHEQNPNKDDIIVFKLSVEDYGFIKENL